MSFIGRTVFRFANRSSNSKVSAMFTQAQYSMRPLTRSLVVLSSPSHKLHSNKQSKPSMLCSCGCGIHGMHTKGDRELVEFLQDEITSEKKNLQGKVVTALDDFTVKSNGAELILTKKFHDEEITISLNVNHTVDSEHPAELQPPQEEQGDIIGELKSRPDFEVDIKVGSKTMSFTCQFTPQGEATEEEQLDEFAINELTFYEGEWNEKTYCVSGDILDGVMYDLLMNSLEERGVSSEFVRNLSDLCTSYEHSQYVKLLEGIQNFIKRK